MAMTLVGIGAVLWFEKGKLNFKDQLLISLSVLMCGSIVGYGGLLLLLIINNQRYLIKVTVNLFAWGRIYKFLPVIIALAFITIISFWSFFTIPLIRFIDLFHAIALNWDGSLESILLAERQFGSIDFNIVSLPVFAVDIFLLVSLTRITLFMDLSGHSSRRYMLF